MLKDFVAYRVSIEFHRQCKSLKLPPFLYDQLGRASASIALNLAEGPGKRTAADQRRYYSIALGSLRECEAVLDLGGVSPEVEVRRVLGRLGAMVFKLARIKFQTTNPEPRTTNAKP
jgi:four helix bundle protein